MEEAKTYIESGILELYVLGQLNAREQQEVEAMAVKFPEVKQEITAIEIAMEHYAVSHSIKPSTSLQSMIITEIAALKSSDQKPEEARIIPLNPQSYESKIRYLRIALVACIALLLISAVALYSAHTELGQAKEQIATLNLDREKFSSTVGYLKQNNEDLQKIVAMDNDPYWKTVQLAGTKMDPEANMTVYWHTSGKHVMMDNSKMHLPVNDQAHQYQLWALVNGKPVDLGVFDVQQDGSQILVNMKEIASAQTFAVTLEKRGGSPSPTMDQMIVAGNVSI